MKLAAMLLAGLVLASQPVLAQGQPIYNGVPPFSLEEAVKIATQCAKDKNLDLLNVELYGALFYPYGRYTIKAPFWEVLWQVPMAKGGSTAIILQADKSCTVMLGE